TAVIRGVGDVEAIRGLFAGLEERARADLARQGHGDVEPGFERRLDVRYEGQAWELEADVHGDVSADSLAAAVAPFHSHHAARFGWNLVEAPIECVNFNLTAIIRRDRPSLPELDEGPLPGPISARETYFGSAEAVETPVYWRSDLHAGNRLHGPAIIAEAISTTLLPPRDAPRLDHLRS